MGIARSIVWSAAKPDPSRTTASIAGTQIDARIGKIRLRRLDILNTEEWGSQDWVVTVPL